MWVGFGIHFCIALPFPPCEANENFSTYQCSVLDHMWHYVQRKRDGRESLLCAQVKKRSCRLCPPKTRWNVSTFLFIAQPRQDGNNRVIRVPEGRKLMLTSGLLIPSIIPASGFKLLVNGVVLLMFPIVVPYPQRCILSKQET